VIRTVAGATGFLKLGFVGSLGALPIDLPDGQTDFEAWFHSNKDDCRFVERIRSEIPGIAVSLMLRGDRQLLTHSGANDHLAETLMFLAPTLIDYLSGARLIHVTSLFDHHSADALGNLLTQVRQTSLTTRISFDPGHHWVHNPTPGIRRLYTMADFLFLNDREFRKLGKQVGGQSDHQVANYILHDIVARKCHMFVKRPHEIAVFSSNGSSITELHIANALLRDDEIEDATGAGDVFAGGILTAWLMGQLGVRSSVEFALELARAKLLERGAEPTSAFREISMKRLAPEEGNGLCQLVDHW
jgi:sugar/nucleoside kinase (ribokinase family)